MKVRLFASLLALLLIATSLKPLFATVSEEPTGICCGAQDDCGGGEICCAPETVEKADCDQGAPGYCRTTCARSGADELAK